MASYPEPQDTNGLQMDFVPYWSGNWLDAPMDVLTTDLAPLGFSEDSARHSLQAPPSTNYATYEPGDLSVMGNTPMNELEAIFADQQYRLDGDADAASHEHRLPIPFDATEAPLSDLPAVANDGLASSSQFMNNRFESPSEAAWNSHKPQIKELYIGELKSLEETMKYMAEVHNFRPSKKMYKEKFREWGWYKNLPKEMALWMFQKYKQRMREIGRDTQFTLGERVWSSGQISKRVQRSGNPRHEIVTHVQRTDMTTPIDITYCTPHSTVSPRDRTPISCSGAISRHGSMNPPSDLQDARQTPFETPQTTRMHPLATRWQNHTRTDIETLRSSGDELARQGEYRAAERKYRDALAGLENLLPLAHDDTNAMAYQLAAFYAQQCRMQDADSVLSRVGEQHINRWGMNHIKTMTHIQRVADLYHSWNRDRDAVAFLQRAFEWYDFVVQNQNSAAARTYNFNFMHNGHPTAGTNMANPLRIPSVEHDEETVSSLPMSNQDSDYCTSTDVVKTEEGEAPSILDLIERCEKYPLELGSETLQAHRTVIDYCRAQKNEEGLAAALTRSEAAFWKIFEHAHEHITMYVLQSAIQLAKAHLISGRHEVAEDLFLKIESEARDILRRDHQAMIRILVDIGIIYQDQNSWTDAGPRFEHALAISLVENGIDSKETEMLEAALDRRHFESSSLNYFQISIALAHR
ncbi:hypothetical protein DIZ76_013922 [Coccidioides immitis]|nr:hypothetical protein DIZ76_013922 [Coccidioides immitis]